MADDTTRDELLTRLQTRVARLEATQPRQRWRGRPPRRFLSLGLVALLAALLPLSLLAANPFTDLVPGSVHNPNIDAIYNAGITTGCVPNEQYCPTDLVTRQEMASFLARTAGIGGNPPVTNAKTAQTADTATNAANAANANTIGGYGPSGLVRVARGSGVIFPNTVPVGTTPTTVGAVTITAPGPGFVLVTGVGVVRSFDASTSVEMTLREAGGAQVSTGITAAVGTNPDRVVILPVTLTWVFAVPGAGARTYQLQADRLNGTSADAYDATLTAIFVPFGSTGGAALGVSEPAPTEGGDETEP